MRLAESVLVPVAVGQYVDDNDPASSEKMP
jgi:hypothetical protein